MREYWRSSIFFHQLVAGSTGVDLPFSIDRGDTDMVDPRNRSLGGLDDGLQCLLEGVTGRSHPPGERASRNSCSMK
jgi:hypothetical protein